MMRKNMMVLALLFSLIVWGTPACAKTYNLRLATVVNAPHVWHDAANYLASEMEARTNGAVKIKIFGGSQLGTDLTTFDEMRMGTIDFVIGGATTLVNLVPEYGVFNMPYFYADMDQFKRVFDPKGEFVAKYKEIFAQKKLGVKLLALGGGGTRLFADNLKPVKSPEDIKGMKMRVPNNPEDTQTWTALGALVTAMPWSEIYSALQAGVVNAFEASLSGYSSSKFYEVAKYMSNTQHLVMVTDLLMSEATWNKLPEEYRKILLEVAEEIGPMFTEKGMESDKRILKELQEKHGVVVTEVDKKAFMEICHPLQDKLAENGKYTDILALMRRLRDGQ